MAVGTDLQVCPMGNGQTLRFVPTTVRWAARGVRRDFRVNDHEPGLTKWHENQRDMNVPPIVAVCLAIGVAIAGTRITGISAIDGVF